MQKFPVKKGDEVVVITGKNRGQRGKIIEVLRSRERVVVEGINIIKRHLKRGNKPGQAQGGIIEREAAVHVSNVMLAERYDARRVNKAPATQPAGA